VTPMAFAKIDGVRALRRDAEFERRQCARWKN
jgi:hypothetical protein